MTRLDRVVVIGTGLIGTSIALALRHEGVEVCLHDRDDASLRLAVALGAGIPLASSEHTGPADVAIIAVPPAVAPATLKSAQDEGVAEVYTDTASVKTHLVRRAAALGCDMTTFVPGHPMGGRERTGPAAAQADLFLGRPWALCPTPDSTPHSLAVVDELARRCGGRPIVMDAHDHDQAVALVSHLPHAISAAMSARLLGAGSHSLDLSGQGVRDVSRLAGGSPAMWTEILVQNAEPLASVFDAVIDDLHTLAQALRKVSAGDDPSADVVRDLLERGRAGRELIPGKHGGPATDYVVLPVVIPDEPGALARLFSAAQESNVNIEDVSLDHSPGLPVAVAHLSVHPDSLASLSEGLAKRGWMVHTPPSDR
ncbi:prephenate dehydrogenase [Sphaerisporangium dianthi]|uniref:Prephenate dehydrogenase n=1 Tax=Sphaerisporangium dianthi TaxID=1436120 RepID=A0ABV9CIU1_9ACTN